MYLLYLLFCPPLLHVCEFLHFWKESSVPINLTGTDRLCVIAANNCRKYFLDETRFKLYGMSFCAFTLESWEGGTTLWFRTIWSCEVGPSDLLVKDQLILWDRTIWSYSSGPFYLVRWDHPIVWFRTIWFCEMEPFDLIVRDHFIWWGGTTRSSGGWGSFVIGEMEPLDLIVRDHFIWGGGTIWSCGSGPFYWWDETTWSYRSGPFYLVRWDHLILLFGTILSGEVGPFDLVVRDHFIWWGGTIWSCCSGPFYLVRWDHLILSFGTILSVRWDHLISSFGAILSGEVGTI